jgi:hypothetical protein
MQVPQSRPWLRFPPPLIEPDLRICRIRLSDRLHERACTGLRFRRSRWRSPSSGSRRSPKSSGGWVGGVGRGRGSGSEHREAVQERVVRGGNAPRTSGPYLWPDGVTGRRVSLSRCDHPGREVRPWAQARSTVPQPGEAPPSETESTPHRWASAPWTLPQRPRRHSTRSPPGVAEEPPQAHHVLRVFSYRKSTPPRHLRHELPSGQGSCSDNDEVLLHSPWSC